MKMGIRLVNRLLTIKVQPTRNSAVLARRARAGDKTAAANAGSMLDVY